MTLVSNGVIERGNRDDGSGFSQPSDEPQVEGRKSAQTLRIGC